MKKPLVSIIIPVYNAESTLRTCLDSVLNQSFKDYEIIVVDNHSIDGSRTIIEEYKNLYSHLHCIYEPYRSRGAARNRGIRHARGDIIAMTDGDCIVPKDWLEALIRPIREEGESFVMGYQKDLINNFWTKNIQRADWDLFQRNRCGGYISMLDTKNFAARRQALCQFMFDPNIGNLEDYELVLRIKDQYKVRFLPEVTVGHHHKSTLWTWLALSYERGYWARIIYNKHKEKEIIKHEDMLQSLSVVNFLTFPFWMVYQFIKRPFGRVWFTLVSELGWRAGILFKKS